MNPNGRVAVLQHAEVVLWESHTIIRFPAAKWGVGALWIEDPFSRWYADRWMDWGHTALQPDLMGLFWGYYRTPEAERNIRRVESAATRCAADFDLLADPLATRPFVPGEIFVTCNIPIGTALYRYFERGYWVAAPSAVPRYYERLCQRSAHPSQIMLDFSELRGSTDF
jgi:glutathione S-transferase